MRKIVSFGLKLLGIGIFCFGVFNISRLSTACITYPVDAYIPFTVNLFGGILIIILGYAVDYEKKKRKNKFMFS